MKVTIQILAALLLVATFSLVSTAFVWATTTREILYPLIFLITLAGFIISFIDAKSGIWVILGSSFFWLLNFSLDFGWFIIFQSGNIALWGVLFLPVILCISLVVLSSKYLLSDWENYTYYFSASVIVGILIPLVGLLSYADKTYERSVFSEFYEVKNNTYKVVFKPQPSDTRKFEVEISSDEVRTIVLDSATFVANHHYLGNTKLKVRMNFSTIKDIQLYKLSDKVLESQISWRPEEVNGEIQFLNY